MKLKNDVLKLTRAADGSVFCYDRFGSALELPREAGAAVGKYFREGDDTTFVVGQFYAPVGSSKKSKLRIVAKALETQRW